MSKTLTVYQLNAAGVYVGTTLADESPLEPGQFLMPAGCITLAPPAPVAGKARVFRDGGWVYVPAELVPEKITDPLPTFEDARQLKLKQLNDTAQLFAGALTASYPPFEKDTWPDQTREALAWEADGTAATPCIDSLAAYRNIDRGLYLQKTLSKVKAYRAAGWYLVGVRQRYEDQIKAAKTQSDLDAITIVFDPPTQTG